MDVTLPSGVIIKGVPEGTSKEEIKLKAIAKGLATEQDFMPAIQPQQLESDVPLPPEDIERLSPDQQQQYFGTQEKPERSFGEKALGTAEAVTAGTVGAIPAMAGMIAGTAQGALEYALGGDYSKPPAELVTQRMQEGMQQMAPFVTPPSEAGQEYLQTVGEAMAPLAGIAPNLAVEGAALRAGTQAMRGAAQAAKEPISKAMQNFELKSTTQKRAALQANTTDSVGYKLEGNKVVNNMLERELLDLNIKDKTITGLRDLGKNNKGLALRTLDLVEDSVLGKEGSDFNRASMVAGERIMQRFKKLGDIQKSASQKIATAVKKDLRGKKVDVSDMLDQYVERVQELGGTFDENGQLRLRPMSSLLPSDARLLREGYQSLKQGIFDAAELHNKKMDWSARIYGTETSSPVKLSPKAKDLMTSVRGQMNSRLRDISKDYAMANDEFSSAIKPLQGFAEAVGKKRFNEILGSDLDMESTRISNFTGDQLRKVFSNYANANQLISAVDDLNAVANSFPGQKFGNEIVPLVRLNTNLESVFGADPATLKGITQDVASMAPGRAGGMIEAAKAGYEAVKKRTGAFKPPSAEKVELINKLREQVNSQ